MLGQSEISPSKASPDIQTKNIAETKAASDCFADPLVVGPFNFLRKTDLIESYGAFYTEVEVDKQHFVSNMIRKFNKNTPLSFLMNLIPIRVGTEVFVDHNKFSLGKKSKLVVCGFALNSPDVHQCFCMVLNVNDSSFYAVPLASLKTDLVPNDCAAVVEENFDNFRKWNTNLILSKARYEEFLPPSHIPAVCVQKRESSGRAAFLNARQKLFEQQSPTKSPPKSSLSQKNSAIHVCECEVTVQKQAGTILKLQGAVRQQSASIAALTATVKELKATVQKLVLAQPRITSTEDSENETSEPAHKRKRGQRGPGKNPKKHQQLPVQVKTESSKIVDVPPPPSLFQTSGANANVPLVQTMQPQIQPPVVSSWPFPFQLPVTSPAATAPRLPFQLQTQQNIYGLGPNGVWGWHNVA